RCPRLIQVFRQRSADSPVRVFQSFRRNTARTKPSALLRESAVARRRRPGFLIDISPRDGYQYRQFRSAPMSRLVVQGDQDGGREIVLRPGINVLGRSDATDHQINDPTVSSFHCEIDLRDGAMVVKDLGSTNGTFINSIPVQQSVLQPGQSLRLGSVEMIYSPQQPPSAPIAPPAVSKPTIRVRPRAEAPPPATALAPEMVPTEPPPPRIESGAPSECRNHPGVPGALICRQCGGLFCKSCVKTIRPW